MSIQFKFSNKLMMLPLFVTMVLLFGSCRKSFLDVPPQAQTPSQQFWKTQDDATKAVNAIYGNLRSWEQVAFAPIAIESMGSDEAEKGSSPNDAAFHNLFDNFQHTSTQGQILDF